MDSVHLEAFLSSANERVYAFAAESPGAPTAVEVGRLTPSRDAR